MEELIIALSYELNDKKYLFFRNYFFSDIVFFDIAKFQINVDYISVYSNIPLKLNF